MESSTSTSDHNFGAPLSPLPKGPVLYVTPLRMMDPSGGPPFLPPSSVHRAFDAFNRLQSQALHKPAPFPETTTMCGLDFLSKRPPSAVRDFPEGTLRNIGTDIETSSLGNAQVDVKVVHAQADPSVPEPCRAPDDSSKGKKRNRQVSTPDAKKVRRSGGTLSRDILNPLHPRKAIQITVRLYDALRRNLLQEEEIKGKEAGKGRPDLYVGSIINSKGLCVKRSEKVVGPFPGVAVGDQFYFRMEISCIGLHGPIQSGIEYVTSKESEWKVPVAISIISSGGYDDIDDGERLIYTGQGGKTADNKANEDQKLERGNLAMEGSMKFEVPVRVIRGIKDVTSPSGKIYTYDGLYKVESRWLEKGKTGFEEFKFKLQRLPGQPELGSSVIKLSNLLKYKPSIRQGRKLEDISRGMEKLPVCVVNTIDDDESPPSFEYSTKVQYSCTFDKLQLPKGCDCKVVCNASNGCFCFSTNGNEFAYLNNGILVKEKDIVYECGSQCKCSPACRNRLTQNALKHRLEIFKTETKKWGVRSWDAIPAGSFVSEYVGRALNNDEAISLTHNFDYVLNLRKPSINKNRWGDVSGIAENQFLNINNPQTVMARDLLLDANECGNMARFINHSCSPNLFAQRVLFDHHDLRFPHVMLFAMDNIPPFRELTLDHHSGEFSGDSQARSKDCACGSFDCRGKVFY